MMTVAFKPGVDSAAELFGALHASLGPVPAGFLDSSDHADTPRPQRSRFSVLGFSFGQLAAVESSETGFLRLERIWRDSAALSGSGGIPQPQWMGCIGYLGDALLLKVTHSVVIDHHRNQAHIISLVPDAGWLSMVTEALRQPPIQPSNRPPVRLDQLRWRDTSAAYQQKVLLAQEQIREGNSYEVCLTTAVQGRIQGSPWEVYCRLRVANRAPFTQFLFFPGDFTGGRDVVLASTSPERFISLDPSGLLRSEPIKGTRRRSQQPEEDAQLARDLAEHPKDRAENVMITDLVRNDLSRYAIPGTVRTERLCAVESYPTVHQLVSTISAQLAHPQQRVSALAAAFPPGSMTGAPKYSTMQILDQLETAQRGFYSGVAGYFGHDGACDLSVVIRSAVLTRQIATEEPAGNWDFHLGVGGAVTADSDPQAEWQEVVVKASGVLNALLPAGANHYSDRDHV